MKNLAIYSVCLIAFTACQTKQTPPPPVHSDSTAVYTVPEEKAINKAVADAYASFSFKMGEKPRYDDIKKYFIPKAQFINFTNDTAQVTNLNQLIYLYRTFIENRDVQSLYEKEIYGKTEQFGHIASRISTYEDYYNGKDNPSETGVNAFQLIKTPEGWKVNSVIWDAEGGGLKVPEYYLPK